MKCTVGSGGNIPVHCGRHGEANVRVYPNTLYSSSSSNHDTAV